jgi:hypothetical protein
MKNEKMNKNQLVKLDDHQPSTFDEYGKKRKIDQLFYYIFYYLGTRPSLQIDGPDIQYFLEGQNARITMLLVGYPVPDITWYHDVSYLYINHSF